MVDPTNKQPDLPTAQGEIPQPPPEGTASLSQETDPLPPIFTSDPENAHLPPQSDHTSLGYLLLGLVAVLLLINIGLLVWFKLIAPSLEIRAVLRSVRETPVPTTQPSPTAGNLSSPDSTAPPEGGVLCPSDATRCPDGTWVGRTGPDCHFGPCPPAATNRPAAPSPNTIAPPEAVFCTQDVKQCPDGSYVSRSGPHCEFEPCPTAATAL